jgi:hypothetical protein
MIITVFCIRHTQAAACEPSRASLQHQQHDGYRSAHCSCSLATSRLVNATAPQEPRTNSTRNHASSIAPGRGWNAGCVSESDIRSVQETSGMVPWRHSASLPSYQPVPLLLARPVRPNLEGPYATCQGLTVACRGPLRKAHGARRSRTFPACCHTRSDATANLHSTDKGATAQQAGKIDASRPASRQDPPPTSQES